MGHIISIVNNKESCGKTTVTCNLADALGKKGKKVLVIDMDFRCQATSTLIPRNKSVQKNIYNILNPSENISETKEFFYPTELRNINLVPNISFTGNLEPELISKAPESFLKLRNVLRKFIVKNYDFTLIDNPSNLGAFTLCSLFASDFCIVPVKADTTDNIEGLFKTVQIIDNLRKKDNKNHCLLKILVNHRDGRKSISKAVIDEIKKIFSKDTIFQTVIPVNSAFERSKIRKETIFQTDPTSSGAKAFRSLAGELISLLN